MKRIEIRPVTATDRPRWGALQAADTWLGGPALSPEAAPPDAPWLWLGAWAGDRCVGRLRARRVQTELVLFDEVTVAATEDRDGVATAMVLDLTRRLPQRWIHLYVEDVEEDRPLRRWVEQAGATLAHRKVVVMRALPFEGDADALDTLSRHALGDMGEGAFARALEDATQGDPFQHDTPRDAIDRLHDLIAYAGADYDPGTWVVFRDGEHTVGVVLPQPFAAAPEDGSLFHIGVMPPYRGRGLGRALHAYGLRALAARGSTRYIGSCDVQNEPMRRIFARNGCREVARQRFYARADAKRDAGV